MIPCCFITCLPWTLTGGVKVKACRDVCLPLAASITEVCAGVGQTDSELKSAADLRRSFLDRCHTRTIVYNGAEALTYCLVD